MGIGIVGVAHGHALRYLTEFRRDERVTVPGIWDHNRARGESAAESQHVPFVADLDDLLGDARVDAVVVCSETNRHRDDCVRAAKAGKGILLQKPMALTLEDCDAIAAAVRAAGVPFMMAFQMRHDPVNQEMRRLVRSGELGKIGLARRRHCLNVLFNEGFVGGAGRWHFDPEQNMGMFMDDATHAADWFRWTFGEPVSVMCEIDRVLSDVADEDSGVALYRFEGGMMGILIHTSVMHAGENTTEIYGDKGVVLQSYGDAVSVSMERRADAHPLKVYKAEAPERRWVEPDLPIPESQGDRIAAVAPAFVEYLAGGGEPPATLEDGRRCVEMILAAYQSAREGKRIAIPPSR